MTAMSGKRRVPLSAQIVVGLAFGVVVGPALGKSAIPLGEIGRLVIQLIKAAATPLVFFAIVNAVLRTEVRGRAGVRMVTLAAINSAIAVVIGLVLSNLIQPGRA